MDLLIFLGIFLAGVFVSAAIISAVTYLREEFSKDTEDDQVYRALQSMYIKQKVDRNVGRN